VQRLGSSVGQSARECLFLATWHIAKVQRSWIESYHLAWDQLEDDTVAMRSADGRRTVQIAVGVDDQRPIRVCAITPPVNR
jgi:hypothetical protein